MAKKLNGVMGKDSMIKMVGGVIVGLVIGVALGDKFEWLEKLPVVGKFFI